MKSARGTSASSTRLKPHQRCEAFLEHGARRTRSTTWGDTAFCLLVALGDPATIMMQMLRAQALLDAKANPLIGTLPAKATRASSACLSINARDDFLAPTRCGRGMSSLNFR